MEKTLKVRLIWLGIIIGFILILSFLEFLGIQIPHRYREATASGLATFFIIDIILIIYYLIKIPFKKRT